MSKYNDEFDTILFGTKKEGSAEAPDHVSDDVINQLLQKIKSGEDKTSEEAKINDIL